MEDLESKLAQLGIDGRDKDVYLAVLRLRKATVIQLANTSGIKRTTVYHCLENLIQKGLVGRVVTDEKKYYFAESPEESLRSIVRRQEEVVKSIAPQLQDILGTGAVQPGIRTYYNANGIRKIFEDVLLAKEKTVRYYVSDLKVDELLGESFLEYFVKKRIEAGIRSLSLRTFQYKPEREQGGTHAKQMREVKFMSEGLVIQPYMCLYDNKMVVISAGEKIGFIIESKEFAEAQKAIFDLIWNSVAI